MPLFFIVSGYFIKRESKLTAEYVKKNAKVLLIPYLLTCLGVIGSSYVVSIITGIGNPGEVAWHWLQASLYGCGGLTEPTPSFVIPIGAVWYLFALFFGKLLLAYANSFKYPLIPVLGFFFCGNVLTQVIWLPLSILQALSATFFLYMGQVVKRYSLLKKGSIEPICWIFMTCIWGYSALRFGRLYMVTNTYLNGAQDIIGSVFGSLVIIKVSEMATGLFPLLARFFSWIGRNTLVLFCMHLIELNVFPYQCVAPYVEVLPIPTWIGYLLLRFALIGMLTACVYFLPHPISKWFFQSKK